jgi:hypothetical protein
MSSSGIFFSVEKESEDLTITTFKNELKFINDLLDFYITLCHNLNYDEKKHIIDEQDLSIFVINLKIINSISCTLNLIKSGYYNDASNVLRNIHESRFLCKYFMKDSNAADRWLHGERLSHGTIIKKLSIPDIENETYGLLCNYTHSNFSGVSDHFSFDKEYPIKNNTRTLDIRIGPVFNKINAENLIILQLLESNEAMISFYNYFNRNYWINFDSKYENRKKNLHKRLTIFIKKIIQDRLKD